MLEVDEEELIRTEYISVPQAERSLGERLIDEVVIPVIRDATTQLLEYGTEKAEIWIEEKVVPVAKSKGEGRVGKSQIVRICNKGC